MDLIKAVAVALFRWSTYKMLSVIADASKLIVCLAMLLKSTSKIIKNNFEKRIKCMVKFRKFVTFKCTLIHISRG